MSGGFEKGLWQLGVLSKLEETGELSSRNLKSIYGTSIGAVLGLMLCANMTPHMMSEYLISRPLQRDIEAASFEERVHPQKGFVSGTLLRLVFSNILRAIDLGDDATLKELYDYSGIDLHLFVVKVSGLELVDLSWRNYPDLPVWRAAHMTTAVPGIFEPSYWEGEVYVDGGLRRNYPIDECLAQPGIDPSTVLGITAYGFDVCAAPANPNCSLASYVQGWFVEVMVAITLPYSADTSQVRTIQLPKSPPLSERFPELLAMVDSPDARRRMVEEGKLLATD